MTSKFIHFYYPGDVWARSQNVNPRASDLLPHLSGDVVMHTEESFVLSGSFVFVLLPTPTCVRSYQKYALYIIYIFFDTTIILLMYTLHDMYDSDFSHVTAISSRRKYPRYRRNFCSSGEIAPFYLVAVDEVRRSCDVSFFPEELMSKQLPMIWYGMSRFWRRCNANRGVVPKNRYVVVCVSVYFALATVIL